VYLCGTLLQQHQRFFFGNILGDLAYLGVISTKIDCLNKSQNNHHFLKEYNADSRVSGDQGDCGVVLNVTKEKYAS